jgi:hypothetical protein
LNTADKICHICQSPDHLWRECSYVRCHMDATYSSDQAGSQAVPNTNPGNQ